MLRVLVDRDDNPARFLVLGSAGPDLLRQSAESLAGRIEYIELGGFGVDELGVARMPELWVRGGFPLSFLRTFVERDLPQFGAALGVTALHRLLAMLAHYHGQILNVAELATALEVAQATVRRYVPADDRNARLEAVERWYSKDWLALDTKLRTSIVEGISVFLSLFDLPDTARLFCPPSPAVKDPDPVTTPVWQTSETAPKPTPGSPAPRSSRCRL